MIAQLQANDAHALKNLTQFNSPVTPPCKLFVALNVFQPQKRGCCRILINMHRKPSPESIVGQLYTQVLLPNRFGRSCNMYALQAGKIGSR